MAAILHLSVAGRLRMFTALYYGSKYPHVIAASRLIVACQPLLSTCRTITNEASKASNQRNQTDNDTSSKNLSVNAMVGINLTKWMIRGLAAIAAIGAGYVVMKLDRHSKFKAIDDRIIAGSKPPSIVQRDNVVSQQHLVDEIISKFITPSKDNDIFSSFGIIYGPTGTAKTNLVQEACRQSPEGTLFVEISHPDVLVRELAKALAMRIKPTFPSILLGKFFPRHLGYYQLPEATQDSSKALSMLIRYFAERALEFSRAKGRPVCLFLDGSDLIAKNDVEVFKKLIDTAKHYASSKALRIVFVCSEGNVLPIAFKTSRMVLQEIGDLPDDKAIEYLTECGMPRELSIRVVEFTGGRMLFLQRSLTIFHKESQQAKHDDISQAKMTHQRIFERIEDDLYAIAIQTGLNALSMGGDIAMDIMKELKRCEQNNTNLNVVEYSLKFKQQKKEEIKRVVASLVDANALRYTANYRLAWDNRPIKNHALKVFKV